MGNQLFTQFIQRNGLKQHIKCFIHHKQQPKQVIYTWDARCKQPSLFGLWLFTSVNNLFWLVVYPTNQRHSEPSCFQHYTVLSNCNYRKSIIFADFNQGNLLHCGRTSSRLRPGEDLSPLICIGGGSNFSRL